jgi:hypothetical protein
MTEYQKSPNRLGPEGNLKEIINPNGKTISTINPSDFP